MNKTKVMRIELILPRVPRIVGGICNSADLCRRTTCRYFDLSEEATKKYIELVAKERSMLYPDIKHDNPPEDCPLLKPLVIRLK